jgi:minor extracellular protease Epr
MAADSKSYQSVSEDGEAYSLKLFNNDTEYYIHFYNYNYEYAFNITYRKEEADDPDSAKEIKFNTEYTKTIDTGHDEDWFKIVTPNYDTTYSLQVTNQSEASTDYLAYKVFDDEKNSLYEISSYKKSEGATKTLVLDAGKTYYIVFYNYFNFSKGDFNYTFKLTKSDTDSLDAPVVSKVSTVSKGFKVTWKRDTDATGYQIRYSTKKNMKNAKTVTVSSTGKKITKLKAKTKYYVQVRAYAKLSTGKKLYSKWSVKKTVTTKK